jgi:hypothetical protein
MPPLCISLFDIAHLHFGRAHRLGAARAGALASSGQFDMIDTKAYCCRLSSAVFHGTPPIGFVLPIFWKVRTEKYLHCLSKISYKNTFPVCTFHAYNELYTFSA